MTPEDYLSELAGKLELTDKEIEAISKKHNFLRERLRERLEVEDDFLTGSYPRRTMIRPKGEEKFDVDFFLAFSNDVYGDYELPKLLSLVKKALNEIKEEDEEIIGISDQNRSIAVEYSDGFQIDVVPSIQIEKDKVYKIFDKKTKQAIRSNPKLHGENLSKANDETASGSKKRLVPIIKLLKSWKREKCDYVKSFHLELLAVTILRGEEIKSYSAGLVKFFSQAEDYLKTPSLKDPANPDNLVDAYLDEDDTRSALLNLIRSERTVAKKALQYENDGENEDAVREWKKIFEPNDGSDKNNSSSRKDGPVIIKTMPAPWATTARK